MSLVSSRRNLVCRELGSWDWNGSCLREGLAGLSVAGKITGMESSLSLMLNECWPGLPCQEPAGRCSSLSGPPLFRAPQQL